ISDLLFPNARRRETEMTSMIIHEYRFETWMINAPARTRIVKPPAITRASIMTRFLRKSEYENIKTAYKQHIPKKYSLIVNAHIRAIHKNKIPTMMENDLPNFPEAIGRCFFSGLF